MRVSGLAVLFEITYCPRKELNLAQPDALIFVSPVSGALQR